MPGMPDWNTDPLLSDLTAFWGWELVPSEGQAHAELLTGRTSPDAEPVVVHVTHTPAGLLASDSGETWRRLNEAGYSPAGAGRTHQPAGTLNRQLTTVGSTHQVALLADAAVGIGSHILLDAPGTET